LFVFWLVSSVAHCIWEQKEEEFAVYEPYCANYTNASELMLMEEQNLVVCPTPAPVRIRSPARLEAATVAVNAEGDL
jgi:hypothetical protein